MVGFGPCRKRPMSFAFHSTSIFVSSSFQEVLEFRKLGSHSYELRRDHILVSNIMAKLTDKKFGPQLESKAVNEVQVRTDLEVLVE